LGKFKIHNDSPFIVNVQYAVTACFEDELLLHKKFYFLL
jgi:hypothetical protein